MVARSSVPSVMEHHGPLRHEYLIAEDEMGDSVAQTALLAYLEAVLAHLYRDVGWFVARNLTFYHPAIQNAQNLISPDIAVFVGLSLDAEEQETITSWEMRPEQARAHDQSVRPSPTVVLEVASKSTWETDIAEGEANKPWLYGQMGVREYFAYDPNNPPVWRDGTRRRQMLGRRLLGWRYDDAGVAIPLVADERGWLWSAALNSWLCPDGKMLRLADRLGVPRLTESESEHRGRLEAELRRQEAEQRRQEAEQRIAALEAELRRIRGTDD